MGQYQTSGTNTLVPNPYPPASMWPGDDVYVLGLSYVLANGPTPGQILAPNDSNVLFEAVTIGERSLAVCLAARPGGGAAPGLIVTVNASANPGASEIDVQDAGIDADGAYLTPSGAAYKFTAWTNNGGIYTAWTELQPESGRFVSLKVIANPNGVKFTAKLSYV